MEKIIKAIEILKSVDFTYPMCDGLRGYIGGQNRAKDKMREFVFIVKQIEDKNVQDILRKMWVNKYEYWQGKMKRENVISSDEYEKRQKILMNEIGLV